MSLFVRAARLAGVSLAAGTSIGFAIMAYDKYQQNEFERFMKIDKEKYLVLERIDDKMNVTRTVLPREDFCEGYCNDD